MILSLLYEWGKMFDVQSSMFSNTNKDHIDAVLYFDYSEKQQWLIIQALC